MDFPPLFGQNVPQQKTCRKEEAMKKLIVLIVLAVAGYFAYTRFVKVEGTAEEQRVAELEQEFANAEKSLNQAGRAAGLGGVDTTHDAAAAVSQAGDIKRRLDELLPTLKEEGSQQKARELRTKLDQFLERNR